MPEVPANALTGIAIVTGALVFASLWLGRLRLPFLIGLGAALLANTLAILLHSLIDDEQPASAVWLNPLVEETVRTVFVFVLPILGGPRVWPVWLAFAFGYGLLETGVKLGGSIVQLSHGWRDSAEFIALIATPFFPLVLLVGLSLLALSLRSAGWGPPVVFLLTTALHALHNASVVFLPAPNDYAELLAANLSRSVVLILLVAAMIAMLRNRPARSV
jgi:hypothetical protein